MYVGDQCCVVEGFGKRAERSGGNQPPHQSSLLVSYLHWVQSWAPQPKVLFFVMRTQWSVDCGENRTHPVMALQKRERLTGAGNVL